MMKLSEAGRLGAMLKPQGFNGRWRDGGSCFFGAALDAVGHGDDQEILLSTLWPFLNTTPPMKCESCGKCFRTHQLITHLNDVHHWTRERIADWVQTIEPQEPLLDTPHEAEVLTEAKAK